MEIIDLPGLMASHPPATFHSFHEFNGRPFGAVDITGTSPVWEQHPDTDEFFYVISGTLEIEICRDDGITRHSARAGSTFVIPRGLWHKLAAPTGVQLLYFTPGESRHSDALDPRQQS